MRQLVYTILISNNHTSFHLWWNENVVKHPKVSKYYETDCSSFKVLKTSQAITRSRWASVEIDLELWLSYEKLLKISFKKTRTHFPRIVSILLGLFYLKCFRSTDHGDKWWSRLLINKHLFYQPLPFLWLYQ